MHIINSNNYVRKENQVKVLYMTLFVYKNDTSQVPSLSMHSSTLTEPSNYSFA